LEKPGAVEAVVVEVLPNSAFRVKLEDGRTAVCHAAGKMRMNVVRIIAGDRVRVELSPFGTDKGRIVGQAKT
jgi:translation initiation factor IF-1